MSSQNSDCSHQKAWYVLMCDKRNLALKDADDKVKGFYVREGAHTAWQSLEAHAHDLASFAAEQRAAGNAEPYTLEEDGFQHTYRLYMTCTLATVGKLASAPNSHAALINEWTAALARAKRGGARDIQASAPSTAGPSDAFAEHGTAVGGLGGFGAGTLWRADVYFTSIGPAEYLAMWVHIIQNTAMHAVFDRLDHRLDHRGSPPPLLLASWEPTASPYGRQLSISG